MSGWNFSLGCHLKSNLVPNNKWPPISLTPKKGELCHVMQAGMFTDGLEAFTPEGRKERIPTHACTYRQTHKWTCTHKWTHACPQVHIQMNKCRHGVHTHECTWVNIYTCEHACVYAWIHLHTQAHCWHPAGVNNTQTGGLAPLGPSSLATTGPFWKAHIQYRCRCW